MQKTARQALTVMAMLGVVLLAVGCGTVDANVHVTYTEAGDLKGELTLRCTGAVGSYLLTPEFKDGLAEEGWKVTTDVDGDVTTLTATNVAKRGEWSTGSMPSGLALGGASGLDVQERGGLFTRTYEARYNAALSLPQQELPTEIEGEELDLISEEDLTRLLESMFKMSLSITLPGRLVDSNADKVEGNTATWYYTYSSLQSEREVYARSERVLWSRVAAAALAAMLLLLAVVASVIILVLVGRRRRAQSLPPA